MVATTYFGVIKAYQLVKKNVDCQLVLAGGGATDDPEGAEVLEKVKNQAADDQDIHVLLLPPQATWKLTPSSGVQQLCSRNPCAKVLA